jgi:hypothetical protein
LGLQLLDFLTLLILIGDQLQLTRPSRVSLRLHSEEKIHHTFFELAALFFFFFFFFFFIKKRERFKLFRGKIMISIEQQLNGVLHFFFIFGLLLEMLVVVHI